MDSMIYWVGIAVRILLVVFLLRLIVWVVFWLVERVWGVAISASGWGLLAVESVTFKSLNLELQVNKVFLTTRWMDPTCSHFFKVNVGVVHVEYILFPPEDVARRPPVRPRRSSKTSRPSRKRRLLYWCTSKVAKLLELSVQKLGVLVHDVVNSDVAFVTELQVSGHVNIIAQPQPDRVLAVSLDIKKAAGQFFLHSETPCPRTDDGLFPLAELAFSTKIFLFLTPLRTVGSLLDSLQINTLPLTLSLMQEGAVGYVSQHLRSYLPQKKAANVVEDPEEGSALQRYLSTLPKKSEIVLEEVQLRYHASAANRIITSNLTRVSMVATLAPRLGLGVEKEVGLPHYTITVGLQDWTVVDSLSREILNLHQLRLLSEHSSQSLSNSVQIESVHASLWEVEAVYWSMFTLDTINSFRTNSKSSLKTKNISRQSTLESSSLLFSLPVSVVTTVEASDWSVLLRMDTPTLQSKEPVCRAVMASGVANVQWSPVEDESTTIRASLRLEDTYLHVPGFHATSTSPAVYRQRIDNPEVLPSLHKHLWGRPVSLGSLVLKAEKDVLLQMETGFQGKRKFKFSSDPLWITGEGCGFMLEWSEPTVVTAVKVLSHLRREYRSLGGAKGTGSRVVPARADLDKEKNDGSAKVEDKKSLGDKMGFPVEVKVRITGVNAFVYGLTPDPPAVMLRLEAASLSSSSPSSPSFHVDLHDLLLENLTLLSPDHPFLCSSIANLPEGVGVATMSSLGVKYHREIKELSWNVVQFIVNWSTTAHRSLLHVATCCMDDFKEFSALMKPQPRPSKTTTATPSQDPGVVSMGTGLQSAIACVQPLCVTVNVDMAKWIANLDREHNLSLSLQTAHCVVREGELVADVYELAVVADKHRVFSLEGLVGKFPHCSEELAEARRNFPGMEVAENHTLGLSANRAEILLPYQYNFGITLDKALSVKRFLQDLHGKAKTEQSGSGDHTPKSLLLPIDVVAECEEIILQLCDDPFEVKLRANYELLCDEYEQKTCRMKELEKKLEEIRKAQGEILSAKKVQGLYDSMEAKDSEIYCQRAREMYSTLEPESTGVFVYSMQQTHLHAMFDPSMLGEERLSGHLKDIDSTSPFPEGGYKFSTLWGLYICGETNQFQLQLRDYPMPYMLASNASAEGRLLFAEQEAQEREKRYVSVQVGPPWGNATVQRKLPPLKWYYDLKISADSFDLMNGPCLEPALAQTNLSFDILTTPTVDTSRPLPYWDKFRLRFHGRIHMVTKVTTITLPGTTDPYNNVEYLELRLGDLDVKLLTNTQLDLEGSLQLFLHTASKYDECELLNLPHVHSCMQVTWDCAAKDPNDHHAVVRCAPDRIPVQPDKQEHDSYSGFRSQKMNLKWNFDVQPFKDEHPNLPSVRLFSSTLRWLEKYRCLLSWNVTRPIRRGNYFENLKPRRLPLTRHWRNVNISASFPKSILWYWSSATQQQGLENNIEQGQFSIDYHVSVHPVDEKNEQKMEMTRRDRSNWAICSCRGNVKNLTVTVYRKAHQREEMDEFMENPYRGEEEEQKEEEGMRPDEDSKCILLSMNELSYTRQEASSPKSDQDEDFKHQVKTLNTMMFVNASNVEVVSGLYGVYKRARMMKRDLSAEALKSIASKLETPAKEAAKKGAAVEGGDDEGGEGGKRGAESPRLPRMQRHGSSGNTMLDQLLRDSNRTVTDAEERAPSDPMLRGINAGNWKDVKQRNWMIELVNTQVTLEGIEHQGFVVASSYVAQVFGCEHECSVREGDLVTKNSWIAKVQDVQYFSTFDPTLELNDVPWLPLSVICSPVVAGNEPNSKVAPHDEESSLKALLSVLGPGQTSEEENGETAPLGEAVGGLVSCLVLPRDTDCGGDELRGGSKNSIQLQRIASRCHCQVFYVTYGSHVNTDVSETPPLLSPDGEGSSGLYDSSNEAVDTFTFRYPTVEVCTTSSQYALIMDILNNLLLRKQPKKKEALARHARMQFTLQLSNIQDPRKPVLVQQNKVRKCLEIIRDLERDLFLEQKKQVVDNGVLENLEARLTVAKGELTTAGMKLRAMIRAFKESQLYSTPQRGGTYTEAPDPVRRIEVWLDDAHWWLTHDDGQLQIADISFTNFSYNRVTFTDDSGEHRLELGMFKVCNLLPNTPPIYQQVLTPYDPRSRKLRVDKNTYLRVFCRDKAPVAGIPVMEHLEFNVVPLAVSLTAKFFQTMQDFFFPKAEEEGLESLEADRSHLFGPGGVAPTTALPNEEMTDGNSPLMVRSTSFRRSTMSVGSTTTTSSSAMATTGGYSPPASPSPKEPRRGKHHAGGVQVDDVERMKERASHIKTFIYVKIPQTTLNITYKSENVSFKDLQKVLVTVPTLEYHNRHWTWTDMLLEVKRDYKNAIIHQTLKSAIGMKESDEAAGLASPKPTRHASDLLLMQLRTKGSKLTGSKGLTSRGKKLFGKLSGSREDITEGGLRKEESAAGSKAYQPPLMDPETDLKRTYKRLTKLSQEAQK